MVVNKERQAVCKLTNQWHKTEQENWFQYLGVILKDKLSQNRKINARINKTMKPFHALKNKFLNKK